MSTPQRNQQGRGGSSAGSPYGAPRHGRIASQSGIQPFFQRGPQTPLPPHFRPTPTVHRAADQPPNDLQRWNGESVSPFMRWAYAVLDARGNAHPNYNYDPDMNVAINVSETIVSHSLPLSSKNVLTRNSGRI